jgi:hypothetical protein
MRELIYIYLLVGLFTVSILAIDPVPYIAISAAAGTFMAFAVFQQMNQRPKSAAVGWLCGGARPLTFSPAL